VDFTNGAHLAVVEIDVETGQVRVLRYVAVDDCGRIVNPALVEGQIAGGIAQGLGGVLKEHCVHDDAGQPLVGDVDGLRRTDLRRRPADRDPPHRDAGAGNRRRVQGRRRRARPARPPRSSTPSTMRSHRSA
jgi:hypothetical protein